MSETTQTHEVDAHASTEQQGFISPDGGLLLFTWITFFALLAILHKFAWKPILAALDAREESIRKAVEDAEKAKSELLAINQERDKIVREAHEKSKAIIDQSHKAAIDAARSVHEKAKQEAQILLENAYREIKQETEKAKLQLREESGQLAIELAAKLVEENLDTEKNQKLISQYIKNL